MTPEWLRTEIIQGLQGLFVLRLANTPAHETAKAVGRVWIKAIASRPIAWDEQLDTPRVRRAFTELSATAERWPSPAEFLRAMPERTPQKNLMPPVDRHMSQKNRELLDGLLARLKSKKVSTGGNTD